MRIIERLSSGYVHQIKLYNISMLEEGIWQDCWRDGNILFLIPILVQQVLGIKIYIYFFYFRVLIKKRFTNYCSRTARTFVMEKCMTNCFWLLNLLLVFE